MGAMAPLNGGGDLRPIVLDHDAAPLHLADVKGCWKWPGSTQSENVLARIATKLQSTVREIRNTSKWQAS
jgi:hypothetical protein